MQLILRWLISALALLALPYVMSGIEVKSFYIALIVAVVLGLFILVINALLFWFVASFVDGFQVSGFWAAFFGAILYSLITWAANALLFDKTPSS